MQSLAWTPTHAATATEVEPISGTEASAIPPNDVASTVLSTITASSPRAPVTLRGQPARAHGCSGNCGGPAMKIPNAGVPIGQRRSPVLFLSVVRLFRAVV